MNGSPSVSLPEELLMFVCDHYTSQRQLGSLARLMTLNQRTSAFVRKSLYHRFDFVDDRSSRYLSTANDVFEKYDGGEELDEDILAAIDCREVDPLDLEPELRWLRNFRTVEVVEVKDMLYGRDIESLHGLAKCLAEKGILLFPNLRDVKISAQVTRRIHSAEAKYPKRTPMILLIILFIGSNITSLTIGDSTLFTPPPSARNILYQMHQPGIQPINGRLPPGTYAHISHAIIQLLQGMHTLEQVTYLKVDPFVPIRPKRGIKHIVSFRPIPPPPLYTPAGPSTIIAPPLLRHVGAQAREATVVDERGYIWEIRQAMIDIIHRSVVPLIPEPIPEDDPSESENESEEEEDLTLFRNPRRRRAREQAERERQLQNQERRNEAARPRKQSSWHFILPFSSEFSTSASTLRMQVRDMVRRKYVDVELVDEVLGNLSFEFQDD